MEIGSLVRLLLAALNLTPAHAAATTLTRGPYLQLLTTESVTIVWRTDVAAACGLAIRPLDGAGTVLTGGTGTTCAIPVAGLVPGTAYAYTPLADGAALEPESTFRTDDPARPFRFLVLGDSGSGGSHQYAVADAMLATPADFILHTGDMVYEDGAAADFDPKFFAPYRGLLRRLVLWPSVGNHDVKTAGGAPWRDAFRTPANNAARSEHYYSFDYGNTHVVVLDSNQSTAPGSPQYVFLDADLAATAATWTIVAFHHTIYSSGSHGSDARIRSDSGLIPLFDAHGVDLVFMGHDHDWERTWALRNNRVVEPGAGTVYVTTGGGGDSARAVGTSTFTAYSESAFHFTRVAIDGGTAVVQMIREDGAVRDGVTLVKGTPPPAPACGDGLVNQPGEQCDGAEHPACAAGCAPDCTCLPVCGDGILNQATEACDGAADATCPGLCLGSCLCGAPWQVLTLAPAADTYVEAGFEAAFDHGAADHLDVDASPRGIAYLRFDLPAVAAPVTRALLTLSCTNASVDGGTVYPVADSSWPEGDQAGGNGPGLTWTQVDTNGDGMLDAEDGSPWVPDFGRWTGPLGIVSAGQAVTVDVTALLAGGPGPRTLAIRNDTSNGASYASREHATVGLRPELRLELGAAAPTTSTSTTATTSTLAPPTTTTSTTVPPSVLDLLAEADTYVEAGTQAGWDHGAADHLDVDTAPADLAYLRFDLSGVTAPVVRATLTLSCTNGAADGGTLYPVGSSSWVEGTRTGADSTSAGGPGLKWNDVDTNRDGTIDSRDTSPWTPDLTRPVAALGSVAVGQAVVADVTAALQGGPGRYSLALRNADANGAVYASRQHASASGRPRLRLELGAPGGPTTTTSSTSSTTSTTRITGTTTSTTRTTTTTSTSTTAPPGPVAVVEADVTVREKSPTTSFGASPDLELDGRARRQSRVFLRVRVTGVGSRRVTAARLRLQVANTGQADTDAGGRLHPIGSCGWDERALTWTTQPAIDGPVVDSAGALGRGDTAEFDVTGAIPGDGGYCFALETGSEDAVVYNAREGSPQRPVMVLEVAP